MRLIDADELKKNFQDELCKGIACAECSIQVEGVCRVERWIDIAPTIETVPLEDYRSMEQTVYKLTQALAEPKVVTNADNLRSITNDMQLALFMVSVNACPYDRDDALFECEKWNGACDRCWLYWLKQKVEDEVEE